MPIGSRAPSVVLQTGAEPVPGYSLIEPLGKGGFGEVWKCSAPGGLTKALKVVPGNSGLHSSGNADQELRALELLRSIRHPFLLSIERIEVVGSDLVIIMELADRSLHDLLADYRERGLAIPRHETIAYLHEAAEVLDLLNQEHGLQHLDIKPRNLFLVGKHLKLGDFGLVGSLADLFPGSSSARVFAGALTPLYAAPETFQGQVTLFSDQYSLAVTYHELVTGEPIFQARHYQQLALMVTTQPPDLSRLPAEERPILSRALAKLPRDRFPSCVEFVNALEDAYFDAANTPSRPLSTSFDISLTDQPGPPAPPNIPQQASWGGNNPPQRGSGHFRRRSRVLPVVQTTTSTDPLSAYQLLESLGRGPAGELWRARGPAGGHFLIRFLPLPDSDPVLERLRSFRHPGLAAIRIVPAGPNRSALITEAGSDTLWDRFRKCHNSGQPGIPRDELLSLLSRVAQVLDELYHHQQIQHLALSPRHIALADDEPILLEFGLAELLWLPQGLNVAALNSRYSAPELFDGLLSDAADQASLALIFQELLVGVHPFRNLNARQMASAKLRGQPDVSFLPAPDRPLVLRALSPEPHERFRSCQEFIDALQHAGSAPAIAPSGLLDTPPPDHSWRHHLDALVASASKGHVVRTDAALPYRILPGDHIECRAWARLAPGMARLKMDGFANQWRAERSIVSPSRFVLHLPAKTTLWDRCLGRSPALQLELCVGPPDHLTALSPIRIHLLPVDCPRSNADAILADMVSPVLTSLVTYMGLIGHRDGQERFPLAQAVQVSSSARMWEGQLRDIGKDGLCVRLREGTYAGPVKVTLHRWASPLTFQAPGRVVASFPADDAVEVEIAFS